MQKIERIQEGPMTFLMVGRFCLSVSMSECTVKLGGTLANVPQKHLKKTVNYCQHHLWKM